MQNRICWAFWDLGEKSQFLVKNLFFFYIFNKVEAGFLFVIGWSWFYRSFCIKINNIAYGRSVFNDKSVILRTFVIKVRCAIYLYFIVFANTFSTKCEFIIDISILAAGQNWAFCDFWWKSIIFRILVKVIFFVGVHLWCEHYCKDGYFRTTNYNIRGHHMK